MTEEHTEWHESESWLPLIDLPSRSLVFGFMIINLTPVLPYACSLMMSSLARQVYVSILHKYNSQVNFSFAITVLNGKCTPKGCGWKTSLFSRGGRMSSDKHKPRAGAWIMERSYNSPVWVERLWWAATLVCSLKSLYMAKETDLPYSFLLNA